MEWPEEQRARTASSGRISDWLTYILVPKSCKSNWETRPAFEGELGGSYWRRSAWENGEV